MVASGTGEKQLRWIQTVDVYVAGDFLDTVNFGSGVNTTTLVTGGMQDIFVSKYDASGNLLWAKQIGGQQSSSFDQVNDIELDASGNLLITGSFTGKADFDPGTDTFYVNALGWGVLTSFVCKLNSSGDFLWARQLGGSLASESNALAVDQQGNVYTTGYFDGIADFDPGVGTFNLTVFGFSDIYVSKLDPQGNFVWAKQMGGSSGEFGTSIAVDQAGAVYLTGSFNGNVDFDPGSGVFNLYSPVGDQEIFVAKLDANGDFLWATQLGGETGYALTLDGLANVYVSGYYGLGRHLYH